jgi:YfiH family protein
MPATPALSFAVPEHLPEGIRVFSTDRAFDSEPARDWRSSAALLRAELERRDPGAVEWIVFLDQVHGGRVLMLEDPTLLPGAEVDAATGAVLSPPADGAVTSRPGVAIVVRTADCLPVVVWHGDTGSVGAVHAGWRGSMQAIAATMAFSMTMLGAPPGGLRGWIGPRIDGARYEVSEELVRDFVREHGHLGQFSSGRLLDLPAVNRAQLAGAGMPPSSLVDSGLCTVELNARFPSHRCEGARRGRIYTVAYARRA